MDIFLSLNQPPALPQSVQIRPLTSTCNIPYTSREHICFGISPFNSLFSEEYIGRLISWGVKNFDSISLFVPDEPTYYTLEALGYCEEDCRRKMKKQLNWLKNKINKSIISNGLTLKDVDVLDWATLSSNEIFLKKLEEVFHLFDNDREFRNSCMDASRWVLQNKLPENEITDKALLKAVKYFLSEIPIFSHTNRIIGSNSALFCYHQAINFHIKLYNGDFNYKAANGQGYGVIHC